MIDVSPFQLETVTGILRKHVPDCEVRAFGSRATWTAKDYSDLDLAVVGKEKLSSKILFALKEDFQESNLPFRVDVLDWNAISKEFRKVIEKNYEVVQKIKGNKQTQVGGILEGWKKLRLSDIMELIGGGTPRTTIAEYWGGEIPWLSVVDFGGGNRWVYKTEKTITQKGLEESSTKILKKGQLIISARGTVGEIAQLGRDMAFNQSCYGIDGRTGFVINDFLYYLLKVSVNDLKRNTHGAIFDTITRETFEHINVLLPPISEQEAIAKILSDLDAKIELNHQMNKTLEQMARAIFKQWFVDFEFPGYEKTKFVDGVPEGWAERPLDTIADFLNGLALQKYPPEGENYLSVIKIRELNQGITESSDKASTEIKPAYIVDDGDVLFSWSGSLDVVLWGHGRGALNQHLFKVTSQEYPKWFYYFWIKEHLQDFRLIAEGKATTMGHIQRHHLSQAMALVPKKEDLQDLTATMEPMIDKIVNNLVEIRQLRQIRDSLLPKLMSGKIRV